MEFAGERAAGQCRWVAIRHGRSTGGSDHAHLVVTLVAEDGSKARVHNDRPRAQKACRELEQRFGLRGLEARTRGGGSRALKHGEIAADRRRGRGVGERGEHAERSSRQRLERVVRACAGAARNETEFVRRLREHGLQARPRYAEGGTSTVVGYSVRLVGGEARSRAGGVVRRRPARARPDAAGAAPQLAPAARRGAGRGRRVEVRTSRRAALGDRAARGARGAGSAVASLHDGDRARAAAAARGGHRSRRRARTRRARAPPCWRRGRSTWRASSPARSRARAGSLPARRSCPPTRRRRGGTLSRASGLALFMLAAGRPDSAVGWLLVCRELGLLAGEIGRVHRARGELRARPRDRDRPARRARADPRADRRRPARPATVELDAETEAARRAREPLGPATRQAPERPADVDDVEAVKRLIDPTRRRRPRQR